MYKEAIDNFGKVGHPLPPTCQISVYGSPAPGTEPILHYAIPLEGVVDPVTIYIHRSLRNIPLTTVSLPPSPVPPTPPGTTMIINTYMSYNIY